MPSGYPEVVVTGDSIAQQSFRIGGYGAALVDEYHGKLDVLNRGMGGWNSRQLLKYLKADMALDKAADIRLFLIHIGTNDSSIESLQSVPLAEFRGNLKEIGMHIRQQWPKARTIILTPSTLDKPRIEAFDASLGIPADLAHPRTPENARLYADACIGVARELGLPVIDVFALHTEALESKTKTLDDLYWDGLHYSPEGYSMINDAIKATIRSAAPDLVPADMEDAFPFFATFGNEADPRSARLAALAEQIKAKLAAQGEQTSATGDASTGEGGVQSQVVTALEATA